MNQSEIETADVAGDKQSKSPAEDVDANEEVLPKVEMSFLDWQRSRKPATNQHEKVPKKPMQRNMRQCGKYQQQQKPMQSMLAPPPAPPAMLFNNYQIQYNNYHKNYSYSNNNHNFQNNFNNKNMHRNYSSFCDDESFDGPGFSFTQIPNQCNQLNFNAFRPHFGGRQAPQPPPPPPRHNQQTNRNQQKLVLRKNATISSSTGSSSAGTAKKSVAEIVPDINKTTTTKPDQIQGTVTNNKDETPVTAATTQKVFTTEKPKTPLKYPRIRGMVRPTKPPLILPTTQEEKEEKKKLWRDYRLAMKPFKNRDFANAKRVIQRLGKKDLNEMSDLDRERYDKAMELITDYKKKLSEKAAARWICTSDGSVSSVDGAASQTTSKVQIYIRKPIVSTYNAPLLPLPPPQSVNSHRTIATTLSQQQCRPCNLQPQQALAQQQQNYNWSSSFYYNANIAPSTSSYGNMTPLAASAPAISDSVIYNNNNSTRSDANNYTTANENWTTAAKDKYESTSYEFDKLISSLPNYATND